LIGRRILQALQRDGRIPPVESRSGSACLRRRPASGFDDLVKMRVADIAAYRRFLGNVLLTLPGVKETRTYAVVQEVEDGSAAACMNWRTIRIGLEESW